MCRRKGVAKTQAYIAQAVQPHLFQPPPPPPPHSLQQTHTKSDLFEVWFGEFWWQSSLPWLSHIDNQTVSLNILLLLQSGHCCSSVRFHAFLLFRCQWHVQNWRRFWRRARITIWWRVCVGLRQFCLLCWLTLKEKRWHKFSVQA